MKTEIWVFLFFFHSIFGLTYKEILTPPTNTTSYKTLQIPRAPRTPTIDGVLEDSEWSDLTGYQFESANGTNGTYIFSYDNQNFYFAAEVYDFNLYAKANCSNSNLCATYSDDSVELGFSVRTSRSSEVFKYLKFNPNVRRGIYHSQCTSEICSAIAGGSAVATNLSLFEYQIKIYGTINDNSDVDLGYTYEISFPFDFFTNETDPTELNATDFLIVFGLNNRYSETINFNQEYWTKILGYSYNNPLTLTSVKFQISENIPEPEPESEAKPEPEPESEAKPEPEPEPECLQCFNEISGNITNSTIYGNSKLNTTVLISETKIIGNLQILGNGNLIISGENGISISGDVSIEGGTILIQSSSIYTVGNFNSSGIIYLENSSIFVKGCVNLAGKILISTDQEFDSEKYLILSNSSCLTGKFDNVTFISNDNCTEYFYDYYTYAFSITARNKCGESGLIIETLFIVVVVIGGFLLLLVILVIIFSARNEQARSLIYPHREITSTVD